MHLRLPVAAFAVITALASPVTAPVAAQPSQALHRDTVAAIDRVFARYSTHTPGCALGVAREGEVVLTRAYGMAELEHGVPIRPSTILEAGSVSKQFTAFAMLLLEQEGKLRLDDPLRKHLPELPDFGAPLTIAHVLSHTSGLRDWYGIARVQGFIVSEHHFRNEDLLEFASRQRALNFPAGREYLYSNTGWNLLAIVVERVTGESFQQYTRRRIFEPLGMMRTRWRDDFRTVVPGRAPAYAPAGDGWRHEMPLMSIVGAGGLLTTVDDLLAWNENLATGRVGGAELVARMQQRSRVSSGREIGYGLGLAVADDRGTREVGHSGATGGYRSYLTRFPERGLSIAVLCNHAGASAPRYAESVATVFLGPSVVRQAGSPVDSAEARAMRGIYRVRGTDEPMTITMPDGRAAAWGYTLRTTRREGSRATELVGVTTNGDTAWLDRMEPWTPSAATLREFLGEYRTDEAPATWRIQIAGDTLLVQGPDRRRIALRPAYKDAFTAPGLGQVVFRRDPRGRVREMSFFMGRVRDIRLARL